MSWRSLELTVAAGCAEALSDALIEGGAASVAIEDAAAGTETEEPLYGEPGMAAASAWPMSRIAALLPEDADVENLLAECADIAGLDSVPPYRVSEVPEQDWVRLTQSQFAPIAVGTRLWIVPSWHPVPDRGAISIRLDPGLAFGTGSHPTTRLCLAWLEANLAGGETVLDYGCGSGILAIAALKLGARRAIGVDIDPQAVIAAIENAARNEVRGEFVDAGTELDVSADIVVSNILANPLKLLAPILAGHCRPGGRLLLSGILETQADDVIAAYRDRFRLAVGGREEGWVALIGERTC
jgi:ribosomal protein L11 methyltransferase